jgi:phosphotriesterase-related protein
MNSAWIQTVKGPVAVETLGLFLPHEHLFTDLRGPTVPDYAEGDPDAVARAMKPNLDAAQAVGVTAFVECSTPGVGRNVAVLQRLAEATPIHLIAPTGVYREAFMPPSQRDWSAEGLAESWVRDLTEGMDGTPVRAGFIKIAMSDDGPTALEIRSLKAAAQASQQTGAVVASHTIGGAVARREMDILAAEGLDLNRFIWVHAQTEVDTAVHLEAASRGAYVELDAIGAPGQSQEAMRDAVLALLDAGYAENILLSHDAGWYQPGRPEGKPEVGIRGYTALVEEFIPALRASGVTDDVVRLLTETNPARAFAFKDRD